MFGHDILKITNRYRYAKYDPDFDSGTDFDKVNFHIRGQLKCLDVGALNGYERHKNLQETTGFSVQVSDLLLLIYDT